VLYRHFPSKRELFVACLAESWSRIRLLWERAIEAEADPAEWIPAAARAFRESEERVVVHALWVQALAEASEDPELRSYMQGHMREVHEFVADVIRRSQAAGGIPPARDAEAEAWIFLAVSFLLAISAWLGGLIEHDVPAIIASRRRWLLGRD